MSEASSRTVLSGLPLQSLAVGVRPLPREEATLRLETRAMACDWGVILNPGPADRFMVASEALSEVSRVESLLTVYREDSDVSRLNRSAADSPRAVTPELFELLVECRRLYDETDCAFDPASQALIELWRTCRQSIRVPEQKEIDTALECCGMNRVQLIPSALVLDSGEPALSEAAAPRVHFTVQGLGLNFGAIGKGYAIDRAAGALREQGIPDFLVHGGHSSLYAFGGHAGQSGWPVGLKNPLFTEASYLTLLLRNQALGTSGSNIQFFRHGGRRYGHILDPRSGWPAESLLSASVIAPTAAEADALSTAFYVLGLENARRYCDTHRSVAAILTPPPERGRRLQPVVCNLPQEQIFPVSEDVDVLWTGDGGGAKGV